MCQNQPWRFSHTEHRRPGRAKQRDFYVHSTWTGSSNYMNKINIKRTIKDSRLFNWLPLVRKQKVYQNRKPQKPADLAFSLFLAYSSISLS